jgi:hypothetical protein
MLQLCHDFCFYIIFMVFSDKQFLTPQNIAKFIKTIKIKNFLSLA